MIREGAYIDCQDEDGDSPLHCACEAIPCNKDIVKILLNENAEVNILNFVGETPL